MLAEQKTSTVTTSMTVTLEITMESASAAPLSHEEIKDLTDRAVESFTSVSRERIAAFNEISRVRHGAAGEVVCVEARRGPQQAPLIGRPAND